MKRYSKEQLSAKVLYEKYWDKELPHHKPLFFNYNPIVKEERAPEDSNPPKRSNGNL